MLKSFFSPERMIRFLSLQCDAANCDSAMSMPVSYDTPEDVVLERIRGLGWHVNADNEKCWWTACPPHFEYASHLVQASNQASGHRRTVIDQQLAQLGNWVKLSGLLDPSYEYQLRDPAPPTEPPVAQQQQYHAIDLIERLLPRLKPYDQGLITRRELRQDADDGVKKLAVRNPAAKDKAQGMARPNSRV